MQSEGTPIEVIVERLSRELASADSIRIVVRSDYRRDALVDPAVTTSGYDSYREEIVYIQSESGLRRLESRLVPSDRSRERLSIDFLDGERAANLLRRGTTPPGEGQVTITRTFGTEQFGLSGHPTPLDTFYVGAMPLQEAVLNATRVGIDRHLDRECDVFLFRDVALRNPSMEDVCYLDRETSVPLKVVRYADDQARREDRPLVVWAAKSIDEVEGFHIPLSSERIRYQGDGSEPTAVSYRAQFEVQEVQFHESYDTSMFWPEISPRMTVFDHIREEATFPRDGTAAAASTSQGSSPPIRATDSVGLPFAPILIGLGGALLVAGLLVRWRR